MSFGRFLAAGLLLFAALPARADGAFPDEMAVLLPPSAPQTILVGATFGLALTEDGGATWRFVCESLISAGSASNVSLYQQAADGAVLAIYANGPSRSGDLGCSWTAATGLESQTVVDAFFDPLDPSFGLAVGWAKGGTASGLYPSRDGGKTFGAPVLETDGLILGVELSASRKGVAYAVGYFSPPDGGPGQPFLLRSDDSGATWARRVLDLPPTASVRIAAVDPVDPETIYLRVFDSLAGSDGLAISTDGGRTLSRPLTTANPLTGFVRMPDGALIAGTFFGELYTRRPGETAFTKSAGPRVRCLGQRNGRLYACGEGGVDGFNLGVSDDLGKTWKPVLRFSDLQGPKACGAVPTACAAAWDTLRAQVGATNATPAGKSGCGCGSGASGATVALGLLLLLSRRRRRPS